MTRCITHLQQHGQNWAKSRQIISDPTFKQSKTSYFVESETCGRFRAFWSTTTRYAVRRERYREREIYISIYIYIYRERERERGREGEIGRERERENVRSRVRE